MFPIEMSEVSFFSQHRAKVEFDASKYFWERIGLFFISV
jgi:hypothetical protein